MPTGPLMIGIKGFKLNRDEQALLASPHIGGVILFTHNFESLTQLEKLCLSIREARSKPILIAVDQEGGRVQRFREGFTRLPAMAMLGEHYNKAPKIALELAEAVGFVMASELLAVGIDFSFAPVLDIDAGISEVIGTRSFHPDPQTIGKLAAGLISGMNKAGMCAIGKHFPGHGNVAADSHTDLPIDTRAQENILSHDMLPYVELIKQNKLAGIMPAHVIYPELDDKPAGFSDLWLQSVLRKQLRFNGAIISDDLEMQAAVGFGDYPTRVQLALKAGCDMILMCHDQKSVAPILETLMNYDNECAKTRLRKLCGHFTLTRVELMESKRWQDASGLIKRFFSAAETEGA